MRSKTSHDIKHRASPNDEVYTPVDLVKSLLPLVPVAQGDTVLDPALGTGNFYNNYPQDWKGFYSQDFFKLTDQYDWLVTNPPYSCLDAWLAHSCKVAKKGFAYLLLQHAVTPKRISACEEAGFGITKMHMSKVFLWYGISQFVIWERGQKSIISYDRKVWR